jgi:hypothetical protein
MDFTRGAPSGPPVTIAWACIKRSICKRAASHPAGTRGARAPTGQTRKKGAVETLFWPSSPDEGAPAPDRPRAHPGDWTVVAIALGDTLVPPEGRGQSWRCPAGSRVPRIAPRGGIQQTRKKETYRSRDASGYGSGSSNRKRRSILSESCRDIRQPRVPGEKGPGPISSEYLLRDRPETREADQFHPGSQKRIFSVIQEVLALGGMGLPSRVDGEQTLLNTFSCRYMNSLPCGVKVNEPGASPVPRNLQTPPTYK